MALKKKSFADIITFARASAATRTNAQGLIETVSTDQPRFDYDPVTLQPKGLLIEEQRTNLLTYSESFDNAVWVKNGTTVTANAVTSPDGTTTADKLVENTASSEHYVDVPYIVTSGTVYVYSVYAKAGERSSIRLRVALGFSDTSTSFDLSSGVVQGGSTNTYSGIQSIGGGWYRCWIGQTATSSVSSVFRIQFNPAIYTGDGTSGIYIWAAQLEAGSFPTSYIPTTSAQATRAADIATITGTNFSSFYNQSEGTLFAEFDTTGGPTMNCCAMSVTDGTANNRLQLRRNADSNYSTFLVNAGGVSQALINSATGLFPALTVGKLAGSYGSIGFSSALNSVLVGTIAGGTVPAVNEVRIGFGVNSHYVNGHIKRIAYWSKAMPSSLQALTS